MNTLRVAIPADAEAIAELVNRAYRPQPGLAGWTHESALVSGARANASQIADMIFKEDSAILLGLQDLKLVACVHVEKKEDEGRIGMLCVDPVFQSTGIGKQMLSQAENYAAVNFRSHKFVMLVVSARSELIAFYSRRGYRATGCMLDYPLSAGVGTPKRDGLKIEILEKRLDAAFEGNEQ